MLLAVINSAPRLLLGKLKLSASIEHCEFAASFSFIGLANLSGDC